MAPVVDPDNDQTPRFVEPPPLPDEPITCDQLTKAWRIYQLARGHRFSTDDMLTAWMAARLAPTATLQLDLGSGIGSVGLMTLHQLPPHTRLVMVEAQQISHALAKRTVQLNELADRVETRLGDLRDPTVLPERDHFPIVTGSPPYLPIGRGVMSPHPQRAACRMELRGTIADYALTAARVMHPDGLFVFCFAAGDPRAASAIRAAGLWTCAQREIHFREDRPPTISLYAAQRQRAQLNLEPPLCVRDGTGRYTEAYQEIRSIMGFPECKVSP